MTTTEPVDVKSAEDDLALEERLVQFARDMRPELIERQAEAEANTFYTEAVHQKFQEAGLYKLFIPKAHGGYELPARAYYRVVMELARADMGTAWCFALSANHALMFANWFPEEIHAEVYNNGDFRAASMYAPSVFAEKTEGGYIVNGTVNYCSGIPYSTYFLGQARLEGTQPNGAPRLGVYMAPRETYTRLNDWGRTLGLKASGSHSIRFENAFLPERFMLEDVDMITVGFDGDSPGSKAYNNPMYSGRHGSSFAMILGALCVGGGYNALDEFENQMRSRKTTVPPFVPRTEDPDFLRYFGNAKVRLSLAEASIMNAVEQWTQATIDNVSGAEPFTVAKDNLLGGIGREVMIYVWDTVDALYQVIGSSASYDGERFQRIYRDLAQAAGHRNPQLRDFSYRTIAKDTLGLS